MTKSKRPTSAAVPRSLLAGDYRRRLREKEEAEDREWSARCGPVEVRKVESTRVGGNGD